VTTDRRHITVGGIPVEVVRKQIRNLHLGVYPPNGRVRVAVPQRLDDEAVRLAIVSRLSWIRRQQAGFRRQDRQSRRELVGGESHYFQGRRYRLQVIEHEGPALISLRSSMTMVLRIRAGAQQQQREAALQRWYRARLYEQIRPLLDKWQPKVGVTVSEVRIKKMKTLWGSCSAEARRVWVNLELVKKPASCLEYILVHEMVHLIERHHNDRFRELMDGLLPSWRQCRDDLNRAPLAHEEWRY
jgi:hypothetical protein